MTQKRISPGLLAVIVGFSLTLAQHARAGVPPGADLERRIVSGPTVDDLVRYARGANPALAAASARLDAVAAESRVATSRPDPSLTATWWPERAGDNLAERWEFMLSQSVPLPGKLGAVGRSRRAEEELSRIDAEITARDIALKVRESAHELRYLRTAREIARGNGELLARLRTAGEAAYALDRTGLYDALRAQSQEAQAGFDAALLAELETTELARLNSLLSRPAGAAVGPIAPPPARALALGVAEIGAMAEAGREEIRAAAAERQRTAAERTVATFENLPELMLGAGYERESSIGEDDAVGRYKFELGMTLPVLFGKSAGRRAAARAGEARAAALEREAVDTVRAEVREAWFRLVNAERLVRLYAVTLLPQSLAAVQRAEVWYREKQGSFANLVEAEALWYNFQLALARAEADREKALARLEALAGREITVAAEPRAGEGPTRRDDKAWTEALERLREERARQEVVAESGDLGEALAGADPARVAALAPAAEDAGAAAGALAEGFPLADLELLALLRNPAVRGAVQDFRAGLEGYDQVTALDEVLRQYATAAGGLMPLVGEAPMGDSPQERFPFPGMLALKGEIVTQEVKGAAEDLALARREALAEARRLYWSLVFNRRAAEVTGEIGELLGKIEQATRARYESGQGLVGEIARAQIELEKRAVELENLAGERGVIEAGIRALLALPRGARIGKPRGDEELRLPAEEGTLAAAALERRQELRRMRAEAGAMERMIAMAEREVVPGFSLDLSLFENRPATQAGTMAVEPPFAIDRPAAEGAGTPRRPWFGRGAAYVLEVRGRLSALRERIRGEEERTVSMVREAWFTLERARREEQLYSGRVAELSRLAGETLERNYRVGKASLSEALEASRERLESGLEAARRRSEVGAALAGLESVVGGPLGAGSVEGGR